MKDSQHLGPEHSSQECLAITAAAARSSSSKTHRRVLFREHQETGARRGPMYPNRQPRTMEHLETIMRRPELPVEKSLDFKSTSDLKGLHKM